MTDGGGESRRDHEKPNLSRKSDADDFVRHIAKVAVAQICESEGFHTFQQSALETLSDVAFRYMHEIGKISLYYANLAGRTEVNALDIIQGLEDLGSVVGFSGASDVDHCLAHSGTVHEIVQYVDDAEEIPFAYAIPRFPVVKDRKRTHSFLQAGQEPPDDHIPAWLPVFPDSQKNIGMPAKEEGAEGTPTIDTDTSRKHTEVEQSVPNSDRQYACNGSAGPSTGAGPKVKEVAGLNPFLAQPLQFGEKEISPAVLPVQLSNETLFRNDGMQKQPLDGSMSALKTFAPAIEAMKSGLKDSNEAHKKVILDKRPAVTFKIHIGRKNFSSSLDLSHPNKGVKECSSWFSVDSDKDEKKRRAEQILKESMENFQHLPEE